MAVQRSLASCPACGSDVTPGSVIIAYEHSERGEAAYASCPACERVVGVSL